jgi:ketosteroid isomerase-like protein
MKQARKTTMFIMVLALLTTMGTSFTGADETEAPRMDTSDSAALMTAIAQFYIALNEIFKGEVAAMEEVWSHDEDTSYMGPMGGMKSGWGEISAQWKAVAARNLGGEIRSEREKAILGSKLAVVYSVEVGHHVDEDGNREDVSIRATNIFRKEDGQWKMIGHHTDLTATPGE